jgi:hypothetical protein
MKFHAYRRSGPRFVLEPLFGTVYEFLPDAEGRLVCDVQDAAAIARLGEIPEAFRPLDVTPKEAEQAGVPRAFVLTGPDATEVDLGPMDDDALRKFAADNGVKPGTRKGDKLREFIVAALTQPDGDDAE